MGEDLHGMEEIGFQVSCGVKTVPKPKIDPGGQNAQLSNRCFHHVCHACVVDFVRHVSCFKLAPEGHRAASLHDILA